jgi:alpha/beta superfamily hydrolase
MLLTIPGPAGPLEALLDVPEAAFAAPAAPPRAAVVFAHPHPVYGGTMHTRAVYHGAKGLARLGCAVLRFNFRGVGTSAGDFDQGLGEVDDYRAALNDMHERFPGVPLWAAGFSFGAWVALETGAADPRVTALIGIAPPVAGHGFSFPLTLESGTPKYFIQGDMDALCPLKDLRTFYARLREPKELVVVDGASHLFEGQSREVGEALEDLLGDLT